MFDYEEYIQECTKIHSANEKYLELFETYLISFGLSDKTIITHLLNVKFFLNDYLLHVELCTMEEGIDMLDMFLGNFYIQKCKWSTPETIKTTAASIKKFYKCMYINNKISKYKYIILRAEIKSNIERWQSFCNRSNRPFLY